MDRLFCYGPRVLFGTGPLGLSFSNRKSTLVSVTVHDYFFSHNSCIVEVVIHSVKRKGRQDDCPDCHWRCWNQASTSPMPTREVTMTTFPVLCSIWGDLCAVRLGNGELRRMLHEEVPFNWEVVNCSIKKRCKEVPLPWEVVNCSIKKRCKEVPFHWEVNCSIKNGVLHKEVPFHWEVVNCSIKNGVLHKEVPFHWEVNCSIKMRRMLHKEVPLH